MGATYIESFATVPLDAPPLAYPYAQYQSDDNIQAFFDAMNAYGTAYHQWFTGTPISVYTSSAVFGSLLDWVGTNYYGLIRPVIGAPSAAYQGGMNTFPMNSIAMNGNIVSSAGGNPVTASDDLYKRTLTWINYRGDGWNFSINWLRKRVARFIYGVGGTDISDVGLTANIRISVSSGSYVVITVPSGTVETSLAGLFDGGWLPVPSNLSFTIKLA
ncbi:MAG: hypothetical protein ACYDBI_05790 [Thermoplasmataceae archaeon]